MIDLEIQKKNFENHVAKFTDYGNIKIVDFKRPDSNEYRIRFLFEEDYCRLHISGDLGELIATNYNNMVFEKFSDFVNNTGYFKEKIDCMNRTLYYYDEEKARNELLEIMKDYGVDEAWEWDGYEGDSIEDVLDDILENFDDKRGISDSGYELLQENFDDVWEFAHDLGKTNTGILDLYMLAFKLAMEQLNELKFRRGRMASPKGFILYRIWYGKCLAYVGRTKQPLQSRLRGHMFAKPMHRAIDIHNVTKIEYTEFNTEADMNLYEIYYINLWKPPLNVDDKAKDKLSICLQDKEWCEFVPANWDSWKKEISQDNSGVALWHRLRNEKALRGN